MSANKNIRLLTLFYLLLGFAPYSAVLVIYFAGVTGSYARAMGLLSVTMVSATLFEIPTGLYSDIIGRRKTLVLGSLSLLVASLLYAIGHSYLVLVLGAVAAGLSRAFFSGNNAAYLYDILAEEKHEDEYSRILGKIGAAEQAGLGVGAVLGGIVGQFSLSLVMWISVVPNAVLLVATLLLAEIRRHSGERVAAYTHVRRSLLQFKANSRLRNLSLASMTSWALSESAWEFQPVFVNSL